MIERVIERLNNYKLFVTSIQNQKFICASVINNVTTVEDTIELIYDRISELLNSSSSQIIHERCFGSIDLYNQVIEARRRAFRSRNIDTNTPLTYIEGESCSGSKFAGVQIRAIKNNRETTVRTILDNGVPKGRVWNVNGSSFYMLQDINSGQLSNKTPADRKTKSKAMFQNAERILKSENASYKDVVRTWIYLSDILDWYHEFNEVRNTCYSEYGFLTSIGSEKAEEIYLPASTGIEGNNPSGLPSTMDVFAVKKNSNNSIKIRPIYGVKQRSPFRYGSAFSRAMVIEEPNSKLILVSGTASIDEKGKSVFIGDLESQIRNTFNVISLLIAVENATLKDICEATIFLKRGQEYSTFRKVIEELGISDISSVNLSADICRDELLFEIDAAFIIEKKDTVR